MRPTPEDLAALALLAPRDIASVLVRCKTLEEIRSEQARQWVLNQMRSGFGKWRDVVLELSRAEQPTDQQLERLHRAFDCPMVGRSDELAGDLEFKQSLCRLVQRGLLIQWPVGAGDIYGSSRFDPTPPDFGEMP